MSEMNSDTSVSPVESLDNLRGLRDEIEMLMDAVEGDIREQGKEEEEAP